ncbi:Rha family transcriptional regulator [Bacillaceae bacterium IKA-2]|nr:Rha family transcriptional regulator [Bacillaceae bacterium IKA-2]
MLASIENKLVFIENEKPVTDSLIIAEAFQKGHDKVLRDIRNLKCSDQFRLTNFGESTYRNKQSRVMPMFIVTFDGFSMLAMGYSGDKAMQFKERYINEFNRTRQILESQHNTLLSTEQKQLRRVVAARIHTRFHHIKDNARRKYFSKLYSELKKQFKVTSYRDIPRSKLNEAIAFVNQHDSPKLVSPRMDVYECGGSKVDKAINTHV